MEMLSQTEGPPDSRSASTAVWLWRVAGRKRGSRWSSEDWTGLASPVEV